LSFSQMTSLFFFKFEETPSLKSIFYGFRWASKTLAISGFYKRCTPWLELKVYCADLKFFVITPRWDTKLLHVKINFIYIYIYIYIYILRLYIFVMHFISITFLAHMLKSLCSPLCIKCIKHVTTSRNGNRAPTLR
jgi:hypothetical protein